MAPEKRRSTKRKYKRFKETMEIFPTEMFKYVKLNIAKIWPCKFVSTYAI